MNLFDELWLHCLQLVNYEMPIIQPVKLALVYKNHVPIYNDFSKSNKEYHKISHQKFKPSSLPIHTLYYNVVHCSFISLNKGTLDNPVEFGFCKERGEWFWSHDSVAWTHVTRLRVPIGPEENKV